MTKTLSQSVAVSMIAVLAASAFIAGFATNSVSAQTNEGMFLVSLSSTRDDALPGDTIGWILQLTNNTGSKQTDIMVKKSVSHNAEGVEYLTNSGVMKLSTESSTQAISDEWGWPEKAILTAEPFYLNDGESLRVEWKETVTGEVLNDWVQTSVGVTTADLKHIPTVYKNTYMVDPSLKINKHFTAAMGASSTTVNPGGRIDYKIIVENDGNVALDNIVINADLPNGADAQWVEYIANSASYSVDGHAGDPVKDGWVGRDTGFNLKFLNPGQTLTFTYSVSVLEDAPHGLTLNSIANIRPDAAKQWTQVAANTTVVVEGADVPTTLPGTTPAELPETGGVSGAAMALWLTAATGLTGAAFRQGRKTILG